MRYSSWERITIYCYRTINKATERDDGSKRYDPADHRVQPPTLTAAASRSEIADNSP